MPQSNETAPVGIETNTKIASAWEKFTGCGEIRGTAVRGVISQSWIKSRELGIQPDTKRAPTVITAEEIEREIKTQDLGRAGISALEKLSNTLNNSEHVVVLADKKGRILYSVGHRQIQNSLEEINFRPGGAWSEEIVGPNGVGTPLVLGRPEVVMGYEHYCKGWQPWVCYGAPIFNILGNSIMGSIDITGPVKKINKETMALAITIAESVQSRLSIIQYHRREILRELGKQLLERWPNEGVLIIDENGFFVEYNLRAINLLNLNPSDFLEKNVTELLPDISEPFCHCKKNKYETEVRIHFGGSHKIEKYFKVLFQPIKRSDKFIGIAMIVQDISVRTKKSEIDQHPIRKLPQSEYSFKNFLGSSTKIRNTIHLAKAAAADPMHSNVLLVGETGTGKELLAHSIHSDSIRSEKPFIAINCAAIPKDLIESELFGYVKGAFTGAKNAGHKGKFELAHNGTLFLDEINSMSLDLQSKLLRVLDSMEITPIGGTKVFKTNVRVIASANQKLYTELAEDTFRQDLYFRLSVLEIFIPPLVDRSGDIKILTEKFLQSGCHASHREMLELPEAVLEKLFKYTWPGNVRELYNLCVRWVLTVSGDKVTLQDIPEKISKIDKFVESDSGKTFHMAKDDLIKRTLEQTGNNISRAAKILGIDRSTIYRRRSKW